MEETEPTPSKRGSTRERKQVTRLEYNEDEKKPSDVIEQQGTGTALGEIETIKSALSKTSSEDEVLKLLHQTLYNKPGKKLTRKKGIREFNGFPSEAVEAKRHKFEDKKWTTDLLKQLCSILCLDRSGSHKKADLVNVVMNFLSNPDESEAVASSVKKRKKSSQPAKKKKAKKVKKKRAPKPLTAYFQFAGTVRATIRAEHPDLPVTEISKKIAELWGEKTDEEKEVYKQQAIDDFNKKYPDGPPDPNAKDEEDDAKEEEGDGTDDES